VLPASARLHRSTDFTTVVHDGARARTGALVVHHVARLAPEPDAPARVGLVVSRAVGGSVVRHRVSRRLRAQLQPRLGALPAGSGTVVRALPAAATATSAMLGRDLDRALDRALARALDRVTERR
jgi:ribonuclease P protein component